LGRLNENAVSLRWITLRAAVVPSLLWLWLWFHLRDDWTLNPQYNYGWAVPFLAVLLFWLRWPSRPAAQPRGPQLALQLFGWLLLGILLPLRVIEEANPDWRLLSWALALVAVAYSLLSLLRVGGAEWAAHFAVPVCFPLVAIPWLVRIENSVVQSLTHAVATVAVEIAGWTGIGAYQLGNVIQLRNGFVGVDEACSGVRTLQAAIMVSLFLGELLRLSASRRILLVLVGCGWVFACNVIRATALVIIAATSGVDAMTRWHDAIGTLVLVVGMAGLVLLAWVLSRHATDAQPEPTRSGKDIRRIPVIECAVAIVWLAGVFVATEMWYRAHERQLIARQPWRVQWPSSNSTLAEIPITDTTRTILRFNIARSAAWKTPPQIRWWSFFARWEPRRAALQLVRSHSPDICLPAIGRTFERELPLLNVNAGGLDLPFRVYQFEQEGKPLFVFVCIQEDKFARSGDAQLSGWSARGRLLAAWNGQRNLGQRLLEIAVSGFDSFSAAEEATRSTVRDIVRPGA
jgi:exosortase